MHQTLPRCLDEEVLIELVHARLAAPEAALAEAHVDACGTCRALLAELLRQRTPPTPLPTPPAGSVVTRTPAAVPPDGAGRSLQRGARIGRFIVGERLGEGGMGVVYVAYDPELAREVALKLVRPREAERSRDADDGAPRAGRAQLRLLREAQAMARLSHPNVRAVYEVGTAEGEVFIAMELVHGVSARQLLRRGPRPFAETLALFVQAGQGLAAAHEAGLLHRDFKPDNILVSHDGRVLITDFGLARPETGYMSTSASTSDEHAPLPVLPLTETGAAVGTPGYISPEQLDGEPVDARADQFSFCVALYEALWGRRPFRGATVAELRAELARRPHLPRAGAPAWVRRVVLRGLSRDPAARYPSMSALLAALAVAPQVRRARRVRLGLAAAALLVVAGAALFYARWVRPGRLCAADAQRRIGQAWGEARRAQAQAALRALPIPYAQAVSARVVATLDAYRDSWSSASDELCAAAGPRGALPDRTLEARALCLDMRLRELSALTAQLVVPDVTTAERAPSAAAALGSIGDCREASASSARLVRPLDPAQRQKVDAAFGELAEAQALQRTGHAAQALQRVERIEASARPLAHRPLWAELALLRGGLSLELADFGGAVTALEDAVLAAEASGYDEAAARAWIKLVEVGARGSRLEDAEGWRQHAAAVIERMGGDLTLRVPLETNTAHLLLLSGKRADAVTHQQRALTLYRQVHAAPDLDGAKMLVNLGSMYAALGQHAEAVATLNQAVALFERELGGAHPMLANALLNLGAALGGSGDTAGEIAAYRRCLSIWEPLLGSGHANLAVVHQNLGTALQTSGRPAEALPHFERALEIKRTAMPKGHPSLASTQFSLGAVLHRLGRSDAGLALVQEALRGFETALGPDHPLVAKALTEIGLQYLDTGRARAALSVLERACGIGADDDFDPAERAEARFGLARALRSTGREPARARQLAEEALRGFTGAQYEKDRAQIESFLRAAPSASGAPGR